VSVRRFRVRGLVQGVGFRYFVVRAGRAAGVAGGVRNERDGSVAGWAEGEPAALERFAAELARGPRAARVVAVESDELPERPAGERFDLEF
jgi:acylphosphatase